MPDLYKTLGVRKNASKASVTKAFRRAALENHPDRGGDRAKYEAAELAYKTLIDAAKRARYDATGETGNGQANKQDSAALSLVSQCFDAVLAECLNAGADPTKHDFIGKMRAGMTGQKAEMKKVVDRCRKAKKALGSMLGRFSSKDGDQFLDELLAANVANVDRELAKAEEALAIASKALEILERYAFRFDEQQSLLPHGVVLFGVRTTAAG